MTQVDICSNAFKAESFLTQWTRGPLTANSKEFDSDRITTEFRDTNGADVATNPTTIADLH